MAHCSCLVTKMWIFSCLEFMGKKQNMSTEVAKHLRPTNTTKWGQN